MRNFHITLSIKKAFQNIQKVAIRNIFNGLEDSLKTLKRTNLERHKKIFKIQKGDFLTFK